MIRPLVAAQTRVVLNYETTRIAKSDEKSEIGGRCFVHFRHSAHILWILLFGPGEVEETKETGVVYIC